MPNLAVTLPDSSAESFQKWLEDFVIKGNSGPGSERNGTLEYLFLDLHGVHLRLGFRTLGIFKLASLPTGAEDVRGVRAEMYCEEISFQSGATSV